MLLTIVVWMGGVNLLIYFHNRRMDKSWWQAFNPLNPPFKDFNVREKQIFVALIIVSLGLVVVASFVGQH